MPIKTIESYNIGLNVVQSDKTKKNIADLKSSFANESKDLNEISKQYQEILKQQGEHTEEAKAYNKLLGQRLSEFDKEYDKIINSMTEEGNLNRKKLAEYKKLQTEGKLQKDQLAEMKRLQNSVVEGTDEELESKRKQLQLTRIQYKTAIESNKREIIAKKSLGQLVKADLKAAKERLKVQLDFIKSLKTTEGRYKAIKKASSAVAKGGAKAAAIGAGIVSGIVGGAVASADNIVESERQARRIKAPLSDEEKSKLLMNLRVATGQDSASIVDAINRVGNTIKTSKPEEIMQMARAELEFPGASTLFQSQTGETKASDYTVLQNRLRAIQSVTGANIGDLSSVMESVSNLRDSAFKSGVSQQDLVSLYAAIQSSNAYDSEEEITRAMRGFLNQSGLNRENFYQKMSEFDWSRYARGSQAKNQADKFKTTFNFKALEAANTSAEKTTVSQTSAEKAAEKARKIALKKDELVARILDKIEPLLESGKLDSIIDSLFKVLEITLPMLQPVLTLVQKVLKALEPVLDAISEVSSRIIYAIEHAEGIEDFFKKLKSGEPASGGSRSNGGIAISPSIVGERGAEAVIPLDYARLGRANNIMQTITQNFTMTGNQTTALSLGTAIKQRSFADNYLSLRLYGG